MAKKTENEKDAYYGIPVLMTLAEGVPPMTPALWVTKLPGQKGIGFLRSRLKLAKAA